MYIITKNKKIYIPCLSKTGINFTLPKNKNKDKRNANISGSMNKLILNNPSTFVGMI